MDFFLTQCFIVKKRESTIEMQDSVVVAQKSAVFNLKAAIDEKNKEMSYKQLEVDNCQSDKDALNNQLRKATKSLKATRFGFKIILSVAILELGYIAIKH